MLVLRGQNSRMGLKVLDCRLQKLWVVLKLTQTNVAVRTEQRSHFSSGVVVVDCQSFDLPINNRGFWLFANITAAVLFVVHFQELFVGNAITMASVPLSVIESVSRDACSVVAASVFLARG